MRIALIGQKGIPAKGGGIERHVEELSVRLAEKGHDVFVYSRKHYTGNKKLKYKGVNLIYLPSFNSKNLDAITHTLFSSIHALFKKYDVIHYHGVGPSTLSFIPRIFKRKAKIVATFHCQDQYHQKWSAFAKAYLRFGEWAVCRFPHETITVSKILRNLALSKYNVPAEYIPNGVAIEEYKGEEEIRKFGLKKNYYLMTCARLVRHKGIHYLIKAFIKLKEQYPNELRDLKLAVVGDSAHTDEYVAYLKKLAGAREDIVFTGLQTGKTLSQLFSNAYVYVHPSESEGLPITVLEAMKFGKTVLVSNIPENIEAFAGLGYMFKNKDVSDLRYKLELLLSNSDLIKSKGKKAKAYVSKNYNWDVITEDIVDLYKKALAREFAPVIGSLKHQNTKA